MSLQRKLPQFLHSQQHTWNLSFTLEQRSPMVCYYLRLFVIESSLALGHKNDPTGESAKFLMAAMGNLEQLKAKLTETLGDQFGEIEGFAQMIKEACVFFKNAEDMDRASLYAQNGKQIVKLYFSSALIFDALKVFKQYDNAHHDKSKFAKWRSTYIHSCLKKGEMPSPPEPNVNDDDQELLNELNNMNTNFTQPAASPSRPPPQVQPTYPAAPQPGYNPAPQAAYTPAPVQYQPEPVAASTSSGGQVSAMKMLEAQKCCKTASSCIDYQDREGAISELEKALRILKTGQ